MDDERRATRLLKVRDVVDRTQLSRAMVYRLVAEGDLPSIVIGRTRRVREADLEAWIERQAATPA